MRRLLQLIVLVLAFLFVRNAGRLLVVEDLRKADAIVVLQGETDRRPALALDLLRQGYARHVFLDVSPDYRIYHLTAARIAEEYIHSLPPDVARSVSVCPTTGLSTPAEAAEVRPCLDAISARSVLVVTSQYHTRRALSVFRKTFPDRSVGVAGGVEPTQFGVYWWHHRQWAKTTLGEWERILWWEGVDRWRQPGGTT